VSDVVVAPFLSSISGSEGNLKEISGINHARNEFLSMENKR